jgi:hypothetical protein
VWLRVYKFGKHSCHSGIGGKFEEVSAVNYAKLDKAMNKTGVEYDLETTIAAIQIMTKPDNNEIAQRNIEPALAKYETCVNSSPGKFSVIQTDIKIYKHRVEPKEDLES